jgi:DNA-binding transcriptional LysR family regulator
VRRETRDGALRALPLADVQMRRSFNYVHLRERKLSPAARLFIDLLNKPFE